MPAVRTMHAGERAAVIAATIATAVLYVCLVPATAVAIPHGGYSAYSVSCQSCHSVHNAPSESDLQLIARNQTDLCYACHDGLGSVYDVRSSFGTTDTPVTSAHPVASGALTCGSCHTPHMGPATGNPMSLSVGPSRESTGNVVCGSCHGVGSTLSGGDIVTSYTASAHDTSMPAPASGTAIKCLACHDPHGSTNVAILKTSVASLSGATNTVSVTATSGPRPLCEGCHDGPKAGFPGPAAYSTTPHGGQTASATAPGTASTQYPGVTAPAGDCEQCHAPHGTGNTAMTRAPGQQLCFGCHEASLASRPATSSYVGEAAYRASAHESLSTTPGAQDGCSVCHAVHGGGQKNPDGSTPAGQLRAPADSLCTGQGNGCHSVAADSASGIDVLASFEATTNDLAHHDVMPDAQARTGAKIACTSCHDPHRESATDNFSDPNAISASMGGGSGRFVNANGEVYALVGAEHDGAAPIISAESVDTSSGPDRPVFTWSTNEAATTWIDWGRTTSYELGSFGTTLPLAQGHSAAMSDVDTSTPVYHYRIRSADALGNQTLTSDRLYYPGAVIVGTPSPVSPADGSTVYWTNGSVAVQLSWDPVTIQNGDWPLYTVEITRRYGISTTVQSATTLASDYTTQVAGSNGVITWRVKAVDGNHPEVQTGFTPLSTFYLSYIEVMGPQIGPRMLFAQAPFGGSALSAPSSTQVAIAEPEAPSETFSVDTDSFTVDVIRGDRPALSRGPAAGWSSIGSELLKPSPASPGVADPGSTMATGPPDGQFWVTDQTTVDHDWNWQMARFDIDRGSLASAQELALDWTGHGEPTPGYRTTLYLWDFDAGSWVPVADQSALGLTTTVTSRLTQPRTIAFCLRCHGAATPPGVTSPTSLTNIASAWTTDGVDAHGDRPGISFGLGGLVSGYSRTSSALDCVVCHDAHGTSNIYHFNTVMNGTTPVTVTDGRSAKQLCYSCHTGSVAVWHKACADCHDSVTASHNSSIPVATPDENSDCLSCHKHGRTWVHQECLSCHGVSELDALGAGSSAHTETFNLF